MITRVEYESQDGRRSATVVWGGESRWHVTFRHSSSRHIKSKWAKTLTSAQGMARQWVGR